MEKWPELRIENTKNSLKLDYKYLSSLNARKRELEEQMERTEENIKFINERITKDEKELREQGAI